MFSNRAQIAVGDRLVHFAVGSGHRFGSPRFFAVSRATTEPEPSGHDQWPWQVMFEYVVRGPLLRYCPSLSDIDTTPTRQRKELTDEQGVEAEALLRRKHSIFPPLGD